MLTPDKVHLDQGCRLGVHVLSGEQVDCCHLVRGGRIHVVCVHLVVCLGVFDILLVCTWVISFGTLATWLTGLGWVSDPPCLADLQ